MYVIKISLMLALAGMAMSASYDPKTAEELYYYQAPSYCQADKLAAWDCEPCKKHPKQIIPQSISIQELQVFYNNSHAAQGYCGYDSNNKVIILAIRGTEENANWSADFDFKKTNYGSSGGQVHEGFLHVYEDLANNMLACAYTLSSNHPQAPIYVTGHSLGAAAATFAALDIHNLIKPLGAFYTFGQPRVGNSAFKTYVEKTLSYLFLGRVTHQYEIMNNVSQDIFVHLPTQEQGFVHFGNEVYYSQDNAKYTVLGSEDKAVNSIVFIDQGANQFFWPWQWTTKDHLYYFNNCAGCTSVACDKYK